MLLIKDSGWDIRTLCFPLGHTVDSFQYSEIAVLASRCESLTDLDGHGMMGPFR
jgi:hypothetical protein